MNDLLLYTSIYFTSGQILFIYIVFFVQTKKILFASKVKFSQAIYHWKKFLEAAKPTYEDKIRVYYFP